MGIRLRLIALLALLVSNVSVALAAPPAEVAVDALLASMGGREAWVAARGYRVEAQHYLADELSPFPNRILFDFDKPRLRIEAERADGPRLNIIDFGDPASPLGWRLVDGEPVAMTRSERDEQRAWWHGNVYRSIHRLARRDAALSASLAEDGRLMIAEAGEPLIWFRVNRAGEPIAFGSGASAESAATYFGPLVRYGTLRFPSFSVRDGGRWRAIIERFEVNPDLGDDAFAPAPGTSR